MGTIGKKLEMLERNTKEKNTRNILQITTYWFVIGWFDNQSAQKSKVRQVAKDIVKSEVYSQTYSP